MILLNVGCCDLPLPRPWINVDDMSNPYATPDIILDGRKLDESFGPDSVDGIYAGHFVEHLAPSEAEDWAAMCYRILKPGGKLGFVTPDYEALSRLYVRGEIPLERMQNLYVFSYDQPSRHATLWDLGAQKALLDRHGFRDVTEIDRMEDPRLAYGVSWQCGSEGTK